MLLVSKWRCFCSQVIKNSAGQWFFCLQMSKWSLSSPWLLIFFLTKIHVMTQLLDHLPSGHSSYCFSNLVIQNLFSSESQNTYMNLSEPYTLLFFSNMQWLELFIDFKDHYFKCLQFPSGVQNLWHIEADFGGELSSHNCIYTSAVGMGNKQEEPEASCSRKAVM